MASVAESMTLLNQKPRFPLKSTQDQYSQWYSQWWVDVRHTTVLQDSPQPLKLKIIMGVGHWSGAQEKPAQRRLLCACTHLLVCTMHFRVGRLGPASCDHEQFKSIVFRNYPSNANQSFLQPCLLINVYQGDLVCIGWIVASFVHSVSL